MEKLPEVGDKKTFMPAAFEAGLPAETKRQVTGTVIWVHPEGRYYVVRVERGKDSWCEAFRL